MSFIPNPLLFKNTAVCSALSIKLVFKTNSETCQNISYSLQYTITSRILYPTFIHVIYPSVNIFWHTSQDICSRMSYSKSLTLPLISICGAHSQSSTINLTILCLCCNITHPASYSLLQYTSSLFLALHIKCFMSYIPRGHSWASMSLL